jgi:Fic family protein
MKIPEPAPDWRKHLPSHLGKKRVQLKEILIKANRDYLYWDKFKYLSFPEGVPAQEAWSVLKTYRGFWTLPLKDKKGEQFNYDLPSAVQKSVYLIDRKMEKVIAEVLTGLVDKEYKLHSIMEEAIASSQVEGAATARTAAKAMLSLGRLPHDNDEKMIENNFKAMTFIKENLDKPLTPEFVKNIHANMTEGILEEAKLGVFRDDENVADKDKVKVYDKSAEGNVLHAPPLSSELEARVNLMCKFANEDDEDNFIHPIIKGIILHFWLAYDHPFEDGNGRTARALFYWYMLKHDYWIFEYLYISSIINRKKTQYLKSFLYSEIDDNDLTYFIVFLLKAIEDALEEVVDYIKQKKEDKKGAIDFLKSYPSLNDRQLALLISALEKPDERYTFEQHARVHGVVRQSARTDLLGLKDLGLLGMRKEGRKFVFTPVADLRGKLRS